ncbi:AcrR family transcriptional regulator [Streptomyces phaeoluteigriseus]
METTTPPRPGLREMKKRRTHDELLRAAVHLFTSQGYERTTVDEIAEAVNVSQRTFFRYFAGKEEAALALEGITVGRFVEGVRARPAHEAPMEALRQAVLEGWSSLSEAIESIASVELYLRMYRVIESTPVLLAAHLRRSAETEEAIARVLAEREGLDVDADPRPRAGGGRVRRGDAGDGTAVGHRRGLQPGGDARADVPLSRSGGPGLAGRLARGDVMWRDVASPAA